MKYNNIQNFRDEEFRRLTGVKRITFSKMVEILREAYVLKHAKGGRRAKLQVEDMLLMVLEYLREYRTYFHVAGSFGVSESAAYNTIKWVEETLIRHPDFALPGRKALLKSDIEFETILIDVTESPIERPKKNKKDSIRERKKSTPLRHK